MDLTMPHEKLVAWNLNVLQRKDSAVMRVMGTASFVTVYEFHSEKRQWKKLDVEGCLFLVRRSCAPLFQLIVLNKMCPEDHVSELGEIEVNDTYLMMSTPSGVIQGFWFYDSQERELVTLQIQKALNELAGFDGSGPPIPYAASIHVEDFENETRPQVKEQEEAEYDREKFKRVLIKLIQTDAEFLDRIYEEFSQTM
jgi:hypothetical protein